MRDLRFFAISSMFLTVSLTASAQFKVTSDGKAIIKGSYIQPAGLTVGGNSYIYPNTYNMGVFAKTLQQTNKWAIGLWGEGNSDALNSTGRSFGIIGEAGNATSGYNYGVTGILAGASYGTAIYGTVGPTYTYISGKYAGYFNGNTYVNGTLTATNVVTPSDIRLKTNVSNLKETDSTLDNLMRMNVISYNYKKHELPEAERDTIQDATARAYNEKWEADAKERHFGLSAQELQEIYPELVKEGQDGFLGINYVELVPILIRSIQELKAELDEVKGKNDDAAKSRAATYEDEETSTVSDATSIPIAATLAQNTPNPFSERTTIHFTLPKNAQNAFIYIFDMSGKMHRQIPVTPDMQSVTIEGYELRAGMYIYSLIIGGKEVQTRRMILTR